MTIRIGVDGFPVSGRRTGVGRYVGEILRAAATSTENTKFDVALFEHPEGPPEVADLEAAGIRLYRRGSIASHVTRIGARFRLPVPFNAILPGRDAYVFTRYWRAATLGRPSLTFVYDLGFVRHPEHVQPGTAPRLAVQVRDAVRRSEVVAVISDTMAAEMEEEFPSVRGKLVVLPPGPPEADAPPAEDVDCHLAGLGLQSGYLLHVGTLEPRKNLMRLIEAMALLPAGLAAAHPLVLAGQQGWDREVAQSIARSRGRVRHVDFVVDDDLRALYAGSELFVFPSLYEGFGMPVLEALHYGLPVACSDIPVMREVAGAGAHYFDNSSPGAIADVLQGLLTDERARAALRAEAPKQAARYSWENSGQALVSVLESMVAQ